MSISDEVTLRDFLACHASDTDIEHIMSRYTWNDDEITREEARYIFADNMMKARVDVESDD